MTWFFSPVVILYLHVVHESRFQSFASKILYHNNGIIFCASLKVRRLIKTSNWLNSKYAYPFPWFLSRSECFWNRQEKSVSERGTIQDADRKIGASKEHCWNGNYVAEKWRLERYFNGQSCTFYLLLELT